MYSKFKWTQDLHRMSDTGTPTWVCECTPTGSTNVSTKEKTEQVRNSLYPAASSGADDDNDKCYDDVWASWAPSVCILILRFPLRSARLALGKEPFGTHWIDVTGLDLYYSVRTSRKKSYVSYIWKNSVFDIFQEMPWRWREWSFSETELTGTQFTEWTGICMSTAARTSNVCTIYFATICSMR